MNEVVEYVRSNGHCPFADWFGSLDNQAAAKVATAVERMRLGNFGDHKSVGGGVMERRIDYGPGYRIYFGRDGAKLVILVGGGTKSRQSSDIQRAQTTWAE
jgi:putative addiction module killer protein